MKKSTGVLIQQIKLNVKKSFYRSLEVTFTKGLKLNSKSSTMIYSDFTISKI
jgi:hypothetical protein